MWRISSHVVIEHRLKIDGGRPLFAWLDFRLKPSDDANVSLTYVWRDANDERWNDAIRQGLNIFLSNRLLNGRRVGYTAIEMNRVISHPIDTDSHAVEYNMTRALEAAFEKYETDTDSRP